MAAYYNEHDERAAAWLRELIAAGEIADGEVDTRSIVDITPDDLAGFTQCHFFAGIGGWSIALRLAGWSDDRHVWTGSCPCQPFSAAGAGAGGADERHLWPSWFWLIERCRPAVVFGEQVEAAIRFGWIDLICDDLEGIGYAVAPIGLPAACVGAFHIRQRLWFVAESDGARHARDGSEALFGDWDREGEESSIDGRRSDDGRLADTDSGRTRELTGELRGDESEHVQRTSQGDHVASGNGEVGLVDLAISGRREVVGHAEHSTEQGARGLQSDGSSARGFWDGAIWIPCRDGKARPTEPSIQPLAHGVSGRVGLLRGAGNAIVPQVAAAFIQAYCQVRSI